MPRLDGVEHSFHELPTGVRVHVAAAGPEGAPVVLCLHGWPQHWWVWREVIPRLGGEVRVLCPDMRGFGWSGWPVDGSFEKERVADDALALLDALGIERVVVAGHDWGAWAATLVALRAPERCSALLAMSTGHPWQPVGRAARNAWRLWYQVPLAAPVVGEALVWSGAMPLFVLHGARRDEAGWRPGEVETYVDALGARASARLYRHFLVRETPRALAGSFRGRRLTVPARLLHGARDPLGREFVRGFPGEVEIVDGAGHFLPEEEPALVAERIQAMVTPPAR
ncbi:MAG: alpha/beta fold hydrolase [Solirubrobacteraceae bacterium]